jgi:lysophospholipase L1-like esterase
MKNYLFSLIVLLLGCGSTVDSTNPSKKFGFFKQNDGSGGIRIFGDSIFATSNHRIRTVLEQHLKKSLTDYSVSGSWTKDIKEQYIKARDQKVQIVIMNGGGNDVFGNSSDCRALNDKCKQVVANGLQNHKESFNMIEEDGVHNIVFLGFHYTTGLNGGYGKVIDYTYPLLEELCDTSNVPCILVDPREKFKNTGGLLEWDGTHPNYEGTKILADMIFDKM